MLACENCDKEGIYWLGGWSDPEAYCLEHWAINQKEPVKTLREQIAREIEERIVERGENEPWDKDINVGLKEAAAIARGSKG